jgi:hemolysin III
MSSGSRANEPHPFATIASTGLLDVATPPPSAMCQVSAPGRPFGRPTWRGRLHAWAFAAAIPAGVVLTVSAAGAVEKIAAAVYASTVVLLFGTSAAYHRLTRTERTRSIMQRVDHSMIYLLIAGTYTPFCLVAMPAETGLPILAFVMLMAIVGIGLKLFAFDRARLWSYALYPAMGWAMVLAAPTMLDHLSVAELALIAAGAGAYLLGIPVLWTKRPDPVPHVFGYHEIWHLCTIVASVIHFVAIRGVLA